jgi:PAS domain S-box-containing protein
MTDGKQAGKSTAEHSAQPQLRDSELEEQLGELRTTIAGLQESERRFKYMIENQGEGIAVVDLEERFVYSNRSADNLFGVRPGDLLNRSLEDFVTPKQFAHIREQTAARRNGKTSTYEIQIVSKSGTRRNLSVISKPWMDKAGRVCGAFASFRDTTELKQAEEQIRRERDKAQKYLDVAGVMLVAIDKEQRVVLMNRKGSELLGYSEEEIVGRNWFDSFLPERTRQAVKHIFQRLMAGSIQLSEYHENPILTKSGEERLIAWRNTLLTDDAGAIVGTLSSGEDITERRYAETELVRYERLRAMGEMTAGISHNLNNILVGVLGHAQFIQRAASDPAILRDVEAIIKAARRAEDLVRRLRWAVLGKEEEIEPVAVNKLVPAAVSETCPRWKNGNGSGQPSIDIITHLNEVPLIQGTRSGLQDILVNLLFNAREAMPRGGVITIETKTLGEGVELRISDTGGGMDERTRKRVFEPFFTTKAEVGTGLGLSTVYGTVTRWGGAVKVESAPERGATFTIWLPKWGGSRELAVPLVKPRRDRRRKAS